MISGGKNKTDKGRVIRKAWPFIIAFLIFLITRLALHFPHASEKIYSENIYPFLAGLLSSASRMFPFSLWDSFWAVFLLGLLFAVAGIFMRWIRLKEFAYQLAGLLAVLFSYFYLSWGFNYFRPPLNERMGFQLEEIDKEEFRSALDSVIVNVNRNYIKIDYSDYQGIDSAVEISYSSNATLLDLSYPNGFRRPKKMIFSNIIAKFGVSGYFGPFFNEINLNKKILPMEYPFLLAHEKAHQFGIAAEADANMAAFIVCSRSENSELRYSGYFCLMLYFLEDAQYLADYHQYLLKLSKPVIDELRFRQEYYYGIQNEKMEKAHEKVYDAYLKGNNVSQGVEDYNHVVELVISWVKNSSGRY